MSSLEIAISWSFCSGQLSLVSCSNNSGRSRTSLNLFDNQDMDEQDKDEPDDRPGTSYNWCNRRSRPTFNFGLHEDDNEDDDEEDGEDDPAPRSLKARQTSTPYLSANQRAQSFCRNSAPAISGLEDDHPPPSAKGKGKGKNRPSTASTSTPLSSRSISTPTANNKRQRTTEDSVMTIWHPIAVPRRASCKKA